jgi:hypothetical protein
MKERIVGLLNVLTLQLLEGYPGYDNEKAHGEYDLILEDFICNYDPELLELMKELIEIKKEFWYA